MIDGNSNFRINCMILSTPKERHYRKLYFLNFVVVVSFYDPYNKCMHITSDVMYSV